MNADIQTAPPVTLTLFGYGGGREKLWALAQMGLANFQLKKVEGLRFWKMMGSGEGGGFSLKPDWTRYALLSVWENAESADEFFAESNLMREFRRRATEIWTIRLLPVRVHGKWSGQNPFEPIVKSPSESEPVAVLTRAAINLTKLPRFWSYVPETSREIERAEGLIASIGIGEAPFFRQATFSLWRSEADMKNFAYQSKIHAEVVKLTRAEKWYKEELFARFVPVASEGKWNGRNPLEVNRKR